MKRRMPQGHATRRRHTNSKLGCMNCKKKKIRCDENLPRCNNCAKGKKSICSYLSLSGKELNKIKLTHSLRSSQNRLLNSDYRLPTSNSKIPSHYDELEFKYELEDLPIRIPTFSYPPLQYKMLSPSDIEIDSKSVDDEMENHSDLSVREGENTPEPTPSSPASSVQFPNTVETPVSFPRLRHQIKVKPQIKLNEYQFMKLTNLDFLLPKIFFQTSRQVDILNQLLICLGRLIIFFEMKKIRPPTDPLVNELTKQCFENHSQCLTNLRIQISEFTKRSNLPINHENDEYMNEMTPILFYANNFISYCIILLDFSMENYIKINSTGISIMRNFLRYNKGRPMKTLLQLIQSTLQFHTLLIKVPAYQPQFINEVVDNIKGLLPLFSSLPNTPTYQHLNTQLHSLLNFVTIEFLPLLKEKKINDKIINCPIDLTFNLLKKWFKIFPSGSFVPINPVSNGNDLIVSDLTSTIYSYYFVIGGCLRTSFPFMLFVFGISFATLQIHATKNFFEISPIVNSLGGDQVQDCLQRHNYYALRLYSFLRHRQRIYVQGTIWNPTYPEDRGSSRWFKNIKEIPIHKFSSTLIRPEHYVTNDDSIEADPGHQFNRTDETMILKLYARNIETLDFFNANCVLQFDYQSMALLRDYRPMSNHCITNFPPLKLEDLDYYLEDRRYIVREFRSNVQ